MPDARDVVDPWLARARSNLQIMYRTALAVSHTLDIDQLLARIMDMIFDWVDADRGCIMLKDLETGQADAQGPPPSPRPASRREDHDQQDDSRLRRRAATKACSPATPATTTAGTPRKSILQLGVREAICVPMQGRYDVVGVIYIDTSLTPQTNARSKGRPTSSPKSICKLMIAIAHQAALAVEDTSYYKAMVQAERLAAVGQTIASLSHHIKNILQGVRGGSY